VRKFDVQIALEGIAEAKSTWAQAKAKFDADVEYMMGRLLHEAARNYMSDREVAKHSGSTVKRVRDLMRSCGLNPRDGKTLLSQKAATALSENAALLGVEPHEMDLMSPLAYLPMGSVMKRELQERSVSQVTEFPETYGTAHMLAEKLTDAGLDFDEAAAWINEVIQRGEQIK
jgi:hypothetical protein